MQACHHGHIWTGCDVIPKYSRLINIKIMEVQPKIRMGITVVEICVKHV